MDNTGKTIDESTNRCFGCGTENPQGLRLEFTVEGEAGGLITATSRPVLTRLHEGAPGYVHGGLIATMLDEAMSKVNRPLNVLAMTRTLSVEYLRPVPAGVRLRLVGTFGKRDGRKLLHSAELTLEDGTVLARGEALFLAIDPALLAKDGV